jgi:hypothetical protein
MAHYLTGDSKYRGLDRANSYFKNLIKSIGDAKLRRVGRELELRRLSLDGPDEAWIPNSLRKGNGAAQ